MAEDEIDEYVKRVLEHAKEADPEKVREEFEKYLEEFLLSPKDSFRSVLRRFEVSEEKVQSAARTAFREGKKVEKFSELNSDDSNVTIEVKVVTYVPRVQMVRGEEKQIALKFLVHLIGDLHQPLHVGKKSDRGGNKIKVKWFGEETNLHQVWDSKMIQLQELSYIEYSDYLQLEID